MYYWQPLKWIKWAPVMAGLPFLAGGWLQTDALQKDMTARAMSAAGDWAKVAFDGRDATVSGQVTGQAALDAAVKAVADTYGVRTVDVSHVKIVAPVPLMAPTIESLTTDNGMPLIKGTWPQDVAKTLDVTLNAKTYKLGTDAELQSTAGHWTLKPTVAIPAGSYDVSAAVSDGGAMVSASVAPGKLVIAAPAPAPVAAKVVVAPPLAAPTVSALITNNAMPMITGTYPKAAAKLMVVLDDKTYTLGTDKELTVDDAGTWVLKPATALKDGPHTVTAQVADAAGVVTSAAAAAPVVVDTAPPAEPTIMAAPADAVWPYAITGTWPEDDAQTMSLSLAGKAYTLGKDKELISDGHGKFTFVPAVDLAPGKYDLDFTVIDKANNITSTRVRDAIVIAAPVVAPLPVLLTAPTIEKMTSDKDVLVIKGTWAAGVAKTLSVSLAGVTYKLGKDFALLSDAAGHWTLKPAKPLANGIYDVVVEVGDGAGALMKDASIAEVEVNVPPPPAPAKVEAAPAPAPAPAPAVAPAPPVVIMVAPTVETSTSESDHPVVKGTWNAGVAKSLLVGLDGTTYKLGTNFELLSDASGKWTLKPSKPLVNGVYDVSAVEGDGTDKTVGDATKDELTVNVAPPPPAPAAGKPYDCVSTIARIAAVFPVRFEFNKDTLTGTYEGSVNQYAALLKDPRCLTLKVQVAGHADYLGSEKYNQGLSERRANTVVDVLAKAGIDTARLTAKGYSKDKPLDPATTNEARMKNRRVEFTVTQ